MKGKRTIITLPEDDKQWLESYSRAYQISFAEAVRRGVRRLRESATADTYTELVENTRGIWIKGDGLKYQRNIRSEWDR